MKRSLTSLLIVALGVAAAPAVVAQSPTPDIGGTWQITATVYLPDAMDPCVYQGNVPLAQDGSTWYGPADLLLLSGPGGCPGELAGDLTGMLSASEVVGVTNIAGTINGADPTGGATFIGSIANGALPTMARTPGPPAAERSTLATKEFQGTGAVAVNQGGFNGASGTWSAFRLQFALDIPGLTPVGLTLLVLLLLGAGAFVLRGQHGAA